MLALLTSLKYLTQLPVDLEFPCPAAFYQIHQLKVGSPIQSCAIAITAAVNQ